jgi:hypothetical protein
MHGIQEPIMEVTREEVLSAAGQVGEGVRADVEKALSAVRFYPIYGGNYANLHTCIMPRIADTLGENRAAFENNLRNIVFEADNEPHNCKVMQLPIHHSVGRDRGAGEFPSAAVIG